MDVRFNFLGVGKVNMRMVWSGVDYEAGFELMWRLEDCVSMKVGKEVRYDWIGTEAFCGF